MADLIAELFLLLVIDIIFESIKFLVYYIGYFFFRIFFCKRKKLEKRYFFKKEGPEEYFDIPAWIIYTVGTFFFFSGIITLIYYLVV